MSGFRPRSARPLYTIGHSTRPVSEFIEILRASAVTRVVDIRRIPWSRRNPQFDTTVLPLTLGRAGLDYIHLAALGGRRVKGKRADELNAGWDNQSFRNYADYARTPPFREGRDELLAMASEHACAIMCAEAVWWRCHRRIVSDHVLAHGVPVVHLLTQTTQMAASLTSFAVVDVDGNVRYPASPPSMAGAEPQLTRDALANPLGPLHRGVQ
jgi:uncharacterized protein (DUF488 family)